MSNQIQQQVDAAVRNGKQILDQQIRAASANVGPLVQRAVAEQVNGLVEGLRQGQALPSLIPSVAAPVDVKADARNRAQRTFWQNLGIDVAIAVLGTLVVALGDLDLSSGEAWTALAILLGKTALSAPISYVLRTRFGVKDTTIDIPPARIVPLPPTADAPAIYTGPAEAVARIEYTPKPNVDRPAELNPVQGIPGGPAADPLDPAYARSN